MRESLLCEWGRRLAPTGDAATLAAGRSRLLIIWFLALVAAGDVLSYLVGLFVELVGLFVEYEWGSYPNLVVFLSMYVVTLYVAWRGAVWLTAPKPDSTESGVA